MISSYFAAFGSLLEAYTIIAIIPPMTKSVKIAAAPEPPEL
jgi:hypothetical protein